MQRYNVFKRIVVTALAQERIFTIDDIYDLPDGKRAELIDGQIYYMAPPNRKHQEVVRMLTQNIANYIEHKGDHAKFTLLLLRYF